MLRDVAEFRAETFHGKPFCKLRNDAAQTLTNLTEADITFNTEIQDRWGMHSTSSNTDNINILVPGIYHVGGTLQFAANTSGNRQIAIRLNDTTTLIINRVAATPAGVAVISCSTMVNLNAGDFITLSGFQSSGGDLDSQVGGIYAPNFYAAWYGSSTIRT